MRVSDVCMHSVSLFVVESCFRALFTGTQHADDEKVCQAMIVDAKLHDELPDLSFGFEFPDLSSSLGSPPPVTTFHGVPPV
mgnify:CR=1 FL=1